MFEASHPFAFFDYFRVPYEVRPPQQRNGHAGCGALRARAERGGSGPAGPLRSLLWLERRREAGWPERGRSAWPLPARRTSPSSGTWRSDAAVPAMLQEPATDWRPAEPILDADGQPVGRRSGGTTTATCSCPSTRAR